LVYKLDLHLALRVGVSVYQDVKDTSAWGNGYLTGGGEPTCADEGERLISGDAGIGVDGGQVDLVEAALKIRDDVAVPHTRAAVRQEVVVEGVASGPSPENVWAEAAVELVIAPVAGERVVTRAAVEQVIVVTAEAEIAAALTDEGVFASFATEGFKGRVATYIERIQFRREAPWTRSARTARVSI
jgi:hypothetical protein